jgi:hypothetical protein
MRRAPTGFTRLRSSREALSYSGRMTQLLHMSTH